MSQIIKGHNKKIVQKETQETLECNCRVKTDCPLNGDCRKESVIYKCTATTCNSKNVYLGLTETEFEKQRYYDHVKSFKNEFYANSTTLSSYVWEIKKRKNVAPAFTWEVLRTAKKYAMSCHCFIKPHLSYDDLIHDQAYKLSFHKILGSR